jgi:MFS family permease
MDRRATLLLSAGHLATDMNQGALPALLPFLVTEYRLSYQQAAGLVFAATFASSIVQPLFGRYADRFPAAWLMPVGILAAGTGLALTGAVHNYWLMAVVLALSGLGVTAFHPEAARSMNAAAGLRKATGMSVFSIGGTAGHSGGAGVWHARRAAAGGAGRGCGRGAVHTIGSVAAPGHQPAARGRPGGRRGHGRLAALWPVEQRHHFSVGAVLWLQHFSAVVLGG